MQFYYKKAGCDDFFDDKEFKKNSLFFLNLMLF